jgi:hypothetical protein
MCLCVCLCVCVCVCVHVCTRLWTWSPSKRDGGRCLDERCCRRVRKDVEDLLVVEVVLNIERVPHDLGNTKTKTSSPAPFPFRFGVTHSTFFSVIRTHQNTPAPVLFSATVLPSHTPRCDSSSAPVLPGYESEQNSRRLLLRSRPARKKRLKEEEWKGGKRDYGREGRRKEGSESGEARRGGRGTK